VRSERNGTDAPGVGAESAHCGVRPLISPRPGAASSKGVRPDGPETKNGSSQVATRRSVRGGISASADRINGTA